MSTFLIILLAIFCHLLLGHKKFSPFDYSDSHQQVQKDLLFPNGSEALMQTIFNKSFSCIKENLNTQGNFIQMISEFCCVITSFTFSSNRLSKKYLK